MSLINQPQPAQPGPRMRIANQALFGGSEYELYFGLSFSEIHCKLGVCGKPKHDGPAKTDGKKNCQGAVIRGGKKKKEEKGDSPIAGWKQNLLIF